MGSYRLLDARPVDASEKEAIGRKPRKRRAVPRTGSTRGPRTAGSAGPTYSDLGRAAVDRLVDLGREVATLRAGLRTAREEAREARDARLDAERRAASMTSKVHDLEQRAEMAEANLRTLLASAKGPTRVGAIPDSEMEAILGVLKGGDETEEGAAEPQAPSPEEP
jgi:chromosome segregation ATPase